MTDRLLPMPEPAATDYFSAIVKCGISAIPDWGGPAAELFGMITAPLLGRRRDRFLEDIRLRLNDLALRIDGLTIESLAHDESFVSAISEATFLALKTHQAKKLEALRNAVVNVALRKEIGADRQQCFLELVDRFTEAHLIVLKFLSDPPRHFRDLALSIPQSNHVQSKILVSSFVTRAIPPSYVDSQDPTTASSQLTELILSDLVSSQLARFQRHQETWVIPDYAIPSGGGAIGKMTTHFGEAFVAFITEPDLREMPNR